MSFIDLATLTLHRRNELESRIKDFSDKCDRATNDINTLKNRSQAFVSELNCEPSALKDRFLNCMKKLDEYMYLITDFNIAISQIEDSSHEMTSVIVSPPPMSPFNMMYTPSNTSTLETPKYKKPKIPRENQLISLSSASTSTESVPLEKKVTTCNNNNRQCNNTANTSSEFEVASNVDNSLDSSQKSQIHISEDANCNNKTFVKTMDVIAIKEEIGMSEQACGEQYEDVSRGHALMVDNMTNLTLDSNEDASDLPAQDLLEVDQTYTGTIMNIDGPNFWVITESTDEVFKFMTQMTQYYLDNKQTLSFEQLQRLRCCAFYDTDSECYYRGLFIRLIEDDSKAEVYAVDTGEMRVASIGCFRVLHPDFCDKPPYARCCHLAGVDLEWKNKAMMAKLENFMKYYYMGAQCRVVVDDNTSESLGVYVILPSGDVLNEILVEQGLAVPTERGSPASQHAPQAQACSLADMYVTESPEHDDPLEAVTGYHNRDEADICKHYKGGSEKTCFKGSRCSKKHILPNPDGWTRDRVEVVAKLSSLPLPPPRTVLRVLVTSVCHFDRVYVNILTDADSEEHPKFGMRLKALNRLVRDMNTAAARHCYNPLAFTPAPGEVVAALYPLDNCWYRARVLTSTRADQNVQVLYVDYGTVLWVKESHLCVLEARYVALPAQAVRCALAGVRARTHDSAQWAAAKRALAARAMGFVLEARVVAREFDELIVELNDQEGNSIAQQLYQANMVNLAPYAIESEEPATKVVVP